MNLFNRLVMILLALALCAAGLFVFLSAGGWLSPAVTAPYPAVARAASALQETTALRWLPAGGAALFVMGLLLFVLEVRDPAPAQELLLREDELGAVSVSLAGLRRLANHVIAAIPGVDAVVSHPRPTREGLQFVCQVVVQPDSSAPDLAEEIRSRLGAAVAHHLGQPAARIHIHTRVAPPQTSGQKRRRVR